MILVAAFVAIKPRGQSIESLTVWGRIQNDLLGS